MSITLKQFVKQTLLDITNAVDEAQKDSPLWIAPGYVEGQAQIEPQMIEFSVQVTVSEEKQRTGTGEVSMPIINILKAGIEGELSQKGGLSSSQNVSFSVPVYFQSKKAGEPPLNKRLQSDAKKRRA